MTEAGGACDVLVAIAPLSRASRSVPWFGELARTYPRTTFGETFAAIDVGTNAARLEMATLDRDGQLETLHSERDPVRPGEAVFRTGTMPRAVADRLLATLRRFGALCRRYHARVRAVATSAVREAKNGADVVKRAREEAGVELEVISGKEEARLICLGVLQGKPKRTANVVIDIGGGSTEIIFAHGERPASLWSTALGSVRLTELFDASKGVTPKQLKLMRKYAAEIVGEALPPGVKGAPRVALGSSGSIRAVIGFASRQQGFASTDQIARAVDELVELGPVERRRRFEAGRADIIVAGAVTLEAVCRHLGLKGVTAVDAGLRTGLLVELARRNARDEHHVAHDAAIALGRRFHLDERHGTQVARTALTLFDDLAGMHRMPAIARTYLEVAALLHDIGHAVSYQRHHKHTFYLIKNADFPGLTDRERDLVARVARYHRRSPPEAAHADMAGLTLADVAVVRKLSTLLRLADALDRSHHQPLTRVKAVPNGRAVELRLYSRAPIDLELWDAGHELPNFRSVFKKALTFTPVRDRARKLPGRRARD